MQASVLTIYTSPEGGSLRTNSHKMNLSANMVQKRPLPNATPPARIPKGFHLLAQGCSPRATLGIAPKNTLNPNGVASDPAHYASAPLCSGPSSGRIPEIELFEVVAIVAPVPSEQAVGELLRVGGNQEILHHSAALPAAVEINPEHFTRKNCDRLCGDRKSTRLNSSH